MNVGRTVFSQLMDHLPSYEFQKCVNRYFGRLPITKLVLPRSFLAMAFAQLTYRESLRDIETCLRSISDKLYHMGFRGTIARSTLADANDCDMPQYIRDNTDDEISHAAFLNAFLISKGEDPVDLDAFRPLQGSQATGAKQLLRLTSLLKLNVDLSWYTRYRSVQNPDLGATFNGPFTITGEHPGAEVGTGRGSRPL